MCEDTENENLGNLESADLVYDCETVTMPAEANGCLSVCASSAIFFQGNLPFQGRN